MSTKKLALLFIIGGIVIVFVLLGSSVKSLFQQSITEVVAVKLKQGSICVVEPIDSVSRSIEDCTFKVGDNLSITYKAKQPAIEKYELVK